MKSRKECGCITCTCGAGSRLASAIIAVILVVVFFGIEFYWK